jgi:hypothetical protein
MGGVDPVGSLSKACTMSERQRELIAAILTAGMLPTLPRTMLRTSRAEAEREHERKLRAVAHAVDLYRSIFEGLGVNPGTHVATA